MVPRLARDGFLRAQSKTRNFDRSLKDRAGFARSENNQRSTPLREPPLALRKVRHGSLDPTPELRRVVGFLQVNQFVNNNVLRNTCREQDGCPVEVQHTPVTARTPTVPEVADLDPSRFRPHPTGETLDTVTKPRTGMRGVPANEVCPTVVSLGPQEFEPPVVEPQRHVLLGHQQ